MGIGQLHWFLYERRGRMRSNVKLGRVSGIEIGLHYSWFIIAALIAFSLGEHFHQINPSWGARQIWITACMNLPIRWLLRSGG
jgi:hypothetical protein